MTRIALSENVEEFRNVLQAGLEQAGINLDHVHAKIIEGTAAAERYGTAFVFSQHIVENWEDLVSNDELLNDVVLATSSGLVFSDGAKLPFHLYQTPGVVAAMCVVAILLQDPIKPPSNLE